MVSLAQQLVFTLISFNLNVSHSKEYPFSSWMSALSSQISSKTVFEIILPGSHKSGMFFSKNTSTDMPFANDKMTPHLQALVSLEEQIKWSERQKISIYEQLMHGIRWLDLQFEYDGTSTFYTHNGLYGLSIHQVRV